MKTKSFTRALILSILAMFMCMALVVGATFAWFTSKVNKKVVISTGELKVTLEKFNGTEYEDITSESKAVFEEAKWEPGYTTYAAIRIVNKGNLALRYSVVVTPLSADAEKLGKVIEVYYLDDGEVNEETHEGLPANRREIIETYEKVGTLADLFAAEEGVAGGYLAEGGMDYAIIALHMQETAGNEYMNKTAEFDITIYATQYTAENDAFDNLYDENADPNSTYVMIDGEYVTVSNRFVNSIEAYADGSIKSLTVTNANDLMAVNKLAQGGALTVEEVARTAFARAAAGNTFAHTEGKMATINVAADINLEGETWIPLNGGWMTIQGNGHTISNIDCDVDSWGRSAFVGYGGACVISGLTLENLTASGSQTSAFIANGEGAKLTDCSVAGNIAIAYNAAANAEEDYGAAGVFFAVFHGSEAVENLSVEADAEVIVIIADTTRRIDESAQTKDCLLGFSLAGSVEAAEAQVTVAESANIDVAKDNYRLVGTTYHVYTAEGLSAIRDFLNTSAAGKNNSYNITLEADIDLKNESWTPIGSYGATDMQFYGTFDGNGHTVSNLLIDSYDKQGTGFIGYLGNNGTVKNLTIHNATVINTSTGHKGFVGVVIGRVGTSEVTNAVVENVHVTGHIEVTGAVAFIGGVIGHFSGTMNNVSVEVDETSFVKGINTGYAVGGIMGGNSGASTHTNLKSNVNVEAYYFAGGVVGRTFGGSTFTNVEVTANITIRSGVNVGAFACDHHSGNEMITVTGFTFVGTITAGGEIAGFVAAKDTAGFTFKNSKATVTTNEGTTEYVAD